MRLTVAAACVAALANVAHAQRGPSQSPSPPSDACTAAATAAFEPCCPGGGGGPTACFYTTQTYAGMCGVAECTTALATADAVCAGDDMADNPTAQAYSILRTEVNCQGLDDPCVRTVQDAMATTCGLSQDVIMEGGAQLAALAQGQVCTNAACMAAMQSQVQTCSTAVDIGTQLTLQVFTSMLGTCGVLADPGMTCTDAQIAQVTADCGDAARPTCTAACTARLSELAPSCPLTFTDPAMVTLATTCGTNAATAAAAPCAPGVLAGLIAQQADCTAFTAALTVSASIQRCRSVQFVARPC